MTEFGEKVGCGGLIYGMVGACGQKLRQLAGSHGDMSARQDTKASMLPAWEMKYTGSFGRDMAVFVSVEVKSDRKANGGFLIFEEGIGASLCEESMELCCTRSYGNINGGTTIKRRALLSFPRPWDY